MLPLFVEKPDLNISVIGFPVLSDCTLVYFLMAQSGAKTS